MTAAAAPPRVRELELARSILGVMPHLRRIAAHACREAEAVSVERFKVLKALEHRPGMRSGELAQCWQLSAPAVTHLVESLVGDGLVRRIDDPSDRRAVRLELTGAGRRELHRFEEIAAAALAAVLTGLDERARERIRIAFDDLARTVARPGGK